MVYTSSFIHAYDHSINSINIYAKNYFALTINFAYDHSINSINIYAKN